MQKRSLLGIFLGSVLLASACGGSGGTAGTGGTGTTGGTGGTASSSTSSSTSGSSTSTSGSGGGGGAATSSSSGASTSSSTSASSSSGTGGAGGAIADHLVISEVGVQPADGEFVEIYNPGTTAVDLTNYYLSDNAAYHGIAAGTPWAPVTGNPGTDFLARFPAGTMLAPGAAIVIASDPTFEAQYMKCPDFILSTTPLTCANGTAKALLAPTNGGIGDKPGMMLSNEREMVVLFSWDGTSATVKDVDYVTWGATFDTATRIDKTGMTGYQPDTARDLQKSAVPPGTFQSIERCGAETGEKASGGNGITGDDETSEAMDTSFVIQAMPTPGAKNPCLP